MAIRAVCAPGNELAASVELAVRGELADVEPHPYLAGMSGVYVFNDGAATPEAQRGQPSGPAR